MTHIERRDAELPYISDASVMEEQRVCRRILQRLNTVDRADFEQIAAIVKELLPGSENAMINPPFYCDYGSHISVGKNFFANYNCTIIDVAKVVIGDNCQFAPTFPSTRQGTPFIRRCATPCMSTASASRWATTCGSAAIPSFCPVCTSAATW